MFFLQTTDEDMLLTTCVSFWYEIVFLLLSKNIAKKSFNKPKRSNKTNTFVMEYIDWWKNQADELNPVWLFFF